jgi:Na+-transporting NADH:ubiquinone oxidoreductase subunit A
MTKVIRIKRGLDIPILGEAEKTITEIHSKTHAIKPIDFVGVFPKPLVNEGDKVKCGSELFFDKYRENLRFTSPVSGTVKEIRRGAKRVLLEIVVDDDGKDEYVDFGKADPNSLDRKGIIGKMLKSGTWACIRQRPFGIVANPEDDPKAIMISAFDTAPLAPDYDFIAHGNGEAFQAGLDALVKLTSGKVYLNLAGEEGTSKVFLNSKGVEIKHFSGPHPAGNVGTQIAHIDPINKGEVVWYLRPQEVLTIGRLFLNGRLDPERVIALTGSEVKQPRYIKTKIGACIEQTVQDNISSSNVRYISGNPLTGRAIEPDGYIGFYDSQITVLPEGDYYELFGWAMPRFNKFSVSRTYFSWLMPKKKYRLDTNFNGGERAYVMTGEFERVFGWDILPLQLIKSILVEDIDEMEQLGIYEVEEEDFALCEFVDTSKTDIQDIVRNGLNTVMKETM